MITRIFAKAASKLLNMMPTISLNKALTQLIQSRTAKLPPAEALRFLFNLDAEIYALSGPLAVAYNGGIHTKHKHTGYHSFFIERISAGERVIDIGCGTGSVAFDVARECGAVVDGIDLSTENINKARSRFVHPSLTFEVQDARQLASGRECDVVILSNVLEHIEDRTEFLSRVVATTQARKFLIRVPSFERDWRVPLKKELGVEWRLDLDHKIEYTLEAFARETLEAGLEIVHLETRWGEIWSELKVQE